MFPINYSVVEVTQNNLKIGDMVGLRLMRRERGSLITTSVPEKETPAPTDFFSVSVGSHSQVYSKLLLANVNDVSIYCYLNLKKKKKET